MRGKALLIAGVVLLLIILALRERERCPPGDYWVMGDRAWICIRGDAVTRGTP